LGGWEESSFGRKGGRRGVKNSAGPRGKTVGGRNDVSAQKSPEAVSRGELPTWGRDECDLGDRELWAWKRLFHRKTNGKGGG